MLFVMRPCDAHIYMSTTVGMQEVLTSICARRPSHSFFSASISAFSAAMATVARGCYWRKMKVSLCNKEVGMTKRRQKMFSSFLILGNDEVVSWAYTVWEHLMQDINKSSQQPHSSLLLSGESDGFSWTHCCKNPHVWPCTTLQDCSGTQRSTDRSVHRLLTMIPWSGSLGLLLHRV